MKKINITNDQYEILREASKKLDMSKEKLLKNIVDEKIEHCKIIRKLSNNILDVKCREVINEKR